MGDIVADLLLFGASLAALLLLWSADRAGDGGDCDRD